MRTNSKKSGSLVGWRVALGLGLVCIVMSFPLNPVWAGEPEPTAPAGQWSKPAPISFTLDYTLVSDYIFRGVNFSEFSGEGREKPNHQMTAGVSYDTGAFGTFGFAAWFEWYAAQDSRRFDPASDGKLQEVDYTLYWSYDLSRLNESIPVTLETGWIAYTFPQAAGDAHYTNEWYITLSLDDSSLFGTEGGVLNPYVGYYLDTDDVKGCWIELGISHDFALAELGMANTTGLKDITVTPSTVLGIDRGQFDSGCHIHNILYGLDVSYDLSSALGIPSQYGSLTLTGFLYFSNAINDDVINDELFGGVSMGYEW